MEPRPTAPPTSEAGCFFAQGSDQNAAFQSPSSSDSGSTFSPMSTSAESEDLDPFFKGILVICIIAAHCAMLLLLLMLS